MPPTAAPLAQTDVDPEPPEQDVPAGEATGSDAVAAPVATQSGSRLRLLLLLLAGVAALAIVLAATGLGGLVDAEVTASSPILDGPWSVLPVAAFAVVIVLLWISIARRGRAPSVVASRRGRADNAGRVGRVGDRSIGSTGDRSGDDAADGGPASPEDGVVDQAPADGGTEPLPQGAAESYGVGPDAAAPLSISTQALHLQVRCLEAALADQDLAIAEQHAAVEVQRAATEEARRAAGRELAAVRDTERRRVGATIEAMRMRTAGLPGEVAVDRVATAVQRLGVDPGFRRPDLGPAAAGALLVAFAPPVTTPPEAVVEAAVPEAVAAEVEVAVAATPEPVLEPVDAPVTDPATEAVSQPASGAMPDGTHAPIPEPAAATVAAPYKVMPVPAPTPPSTPARTRRGLLRGRS